MRSGMKEATRAGTRELQRQSAVMHATLGGSCREPDADASASSSAAAQGADGADVLKAAHKSEEMEGMTRDLQMASNCCLLLLLLIHDAISLQACRCRGTVSSPPRVPAACECPFGSFAARSQSMVKASAAAAPLMMRLVTRRLIPDAADRAISLEPAEKLMRI